MAQRARVGNPIFFRHGGRNEAERVSVHVSAGYALGFDVRHVAGNAQASGAAIFVVRVFFQRRGARAVGRHWAVAIQT